MAESRREAVHPPPPEPLPRPVIDSHCHIDMRGGDEDALTAEQSIAAAAAVNVTGIVQVGCSIRDVAEAVAMAHAHPQIVAAIGIHPNEAPRLAARGELDAAIARGGATGPRLRAGPWDRRDRAGPLPDPGARGLGDPGGGVPGPHRPGPAAGPGARHPRPGRA